MVELLLVDGTVGVNQGKANWSSTVLMLAYGHAAVVGLLLAQAQCEGGIAVASGLG